MLNKIIKVIKLLVIIYIKMNKDIIINLNDVQTTGLIFFGFIICSLIGLISIKELSEELIKMDELTTEAWYTYKSIGIGNQEPIDPIKLINAKKDFEEKDYKHGVILGLDIFLIGLESILLLHTYLSYEDYTQSIETYKKWLKAKNLKEEDGLQ